jgi:hypothetical protein
LKLKLHWTPPGGAREFALIGKRVASIHEVRGRGVLRSWAKSS